MINGPNIENILVLIDTISPDRLNSIFEFLNCYFRKEEFEFQFENEKVIDTYYGCFSYCSKFLEVF